MAVLADEFQTELFLLAGLKANLPTLPERAPAYCIDTNELFIGTAAGNKLINRGMTLAELTVLLNGTYAAKAIESTALLKSGGTMTGNLTLKGAPTADLQAATKKYVDEEIATAVTAATQYKGAFDASKSIVANGITAIKAGDMWKVTVAGTTSGINTPSGLGLNIGDIIMANATKASGILASNFDGIDNTEATDILRQSTQFGGVIAGTYDNIQFDISSLSVALISTTPEFSAAATRVNISSGDSVAAILGKIAKYFSDLKNVAFTGNYNDLSNKPAIPQAATATPNAVTGSSGSSGSSIRFAKEDHTHALGLASNSVRGGVQVDGTHIDMVSEKLHVSIIDCGTF